MRAMPPVDAEAATRVAADLTARLRESADAGAPQTVLVAYGGGKDSSYMVAFVRAAQLYAHAELGAAFRLRVATNRHAGMPAAVMANIDRTYRALGMHNDPSVEMLLIDGDVVSPFAADLPMPADLVARNRTDILMNGHRFAGEARPTFCNACNLSMVNAFGVAAAWDGGADIIVTGDSRDEQKAYLVWTRRLARDFAVEVVRGKPGLNDFLRTMDGLGRRYHGEIHGEGVPEQTGIAHRLPKASRFFSIYGYTDYDAGAHWDFLTGYLGFEFDELAFSFTESDCVNPLLMAHFRGLRDYALGLMRRKQFPAELIAVMAARYADGEAVARMRQLASAYARDVLDLGEARIVCMLSAPFGGRGAALQPWLVREAPALAGDERAIRHLLEAEDSVDPPLAAQLRDLTGLTLAQLRQCWRNPVVPNLAAAGALATPLGRVLRDDPHKATIVTRHAPDGADVAEVISGR
jgi:hypothetical protein